MWNGKAETWDDWEREVTFWTDSFDTRQAPTLGITTGQKSQSSDTCVRRLPLGSKGGACEEHWCGHSSHSVATLWLRADGAERHRSETAGNVGIEHEAEGPFRGFRSIWNPIHQVSPRVGPGTEALGQQTRWMPASSFTP